MHSVECARLVVIMWLPDLALKLQPGPVGQNGKHSVGIGRSGLRGKRYLGARAGRQFHGEPLAVGGQQSRVHHAALEDGLHVVGYAQPRCALRRVGRNNRHARKNHAPRGLPRRSDAANRQRARSPPARPSPHPPGKLHPAEPAVRKQWPRPRRKPRTAKALVRESGGQKKAHGVSCHVHGKFSENRDRQAFSKDLG